jgi:hypothetical protein
MSILGDFLEAVFCRGEKYRTVRGTIHTWVDETRSDSAFGGDRRPIGRLKRVAHAKSTVREQLTRFWIAGADRIRLESSRTVELEVQSSLKVVNRERSWKRDKEGHVFVGEGQRRAPAVTELERHFDAKLIREFCKDLGLEPLGAVTTSGRDCVRLRAVLRDGESLWPHWLPKGADDYEFHGDLQRGLLLGIFARHRGHLLESAVVTSIVFDEPIDEELFIYEPAIGEQVASAPPISEFLSMQAAIARVPFAVLLPDPITDAEHTQLQFDYHPPRGPGLTGRQSLTIHFFNFESRVSLWLTESDSADPDDSKYEWVEYEAKGQKVHVSDPGQQGLRLASVVKDGTHVGICTSLRTSEILDLAATLTRAAPNATQ